MVPARQVGHTDVQALRFSAAPQRSHPATAHYLAVTEARSRSNQVAIERLYPSGIRSPGTSCSANSTTRLYS